MANYGPASAFLLVGGNDMSNESFGLDESVEQIAEETRGLGATSEAWLAAGVARVTLDVAPGLYTDAVFKQIAAFESNQSSRKLVGYGLEGATLGAPVTMIDGAFAGNWKRMAKKEGLTLAGATFVVSGQHYGPGAQDGTGGARILGLNTERSGDGDTESTSLDQADYAPVLSIVDSNADDSVQVVDHGLITGDTVLIAGHDSTPSIDGDQTVTVVDSDNFSVDGIDITVGGTAAGTIKKTSSTGVIVDLHVSSLDLGGGSGLAVIVQDSPDDSVWSTIASFASVTSEAAGTAERITVAGHIERYLSITWAFTGGSSQTATPYVSAFRT